MSNLRREVLKQFKNLHRASQRCFFEDEVAINRARYEINKNFKDNKNIDNEAEIEKFVKLAKGVSLELATNVVQAVEKKPNVYEINIKEEILLDNTLFDPNAPIPDKPRGKKCGSDIKDDKK